MPSTRLFAALALIVLCALAETIPTSAQSAVLFLQSPATELVPLGAQLQ